MQSAVVEIEVGLLQACGPAPPESSEQRRQDHRLIPRRQNFEQAAGLVEREDAHFVVEEFGAPCVLGDVLPRVAVELRAP